MYRNTARAKTPDCEHIFGSRTGVQSTYPQAVDSPSPRPTPCYYGGLSPPISHQVLAG